MLATPADLAAFLASLMTALNQEIIWAKTCDFFRAIGFAHVLYGYSPDSRGNQLGEEENYLVLSTFDQAVTARLINERHYLQSLTFHWELRNVGLASWSKTASECGIGSDFVLSPASLDLFERHGLLTGSTIGFAKERTRGLAAMALIAPVEVSQDTVDEWLDAFGTAIFVVATLSHNCLTKLPFQTQRGNLTRRQREVLEWVAEGKTAADIATIMGITPPTVDKHLRLARGTLGVDTTAHALMKATFLNQVFSLGALPTSPGQRSTTRSRTPDQRASSEGKGMDFHTDMISDD